MKMIDWVLERLNWDYIKNAITLFIIAVVTSIFASIFVIFIKYTQNPEAFSGISPTLFSVLWEVTILVSILTPFLCIMFAIVFGVLWLIIEYIIDPLEIYTERKKEEQFKKKWRKKK